MSEPVRTEWLVEFEVSADRSITGKPYWTSYMDGIAVTEARGHALYRSALANKETGEKVRLVARQTFVVVESE